MFFVQNRQHLGKKGPWIYILMEILRRASPWIWTVGHRWPVGWLAGWLAGGRLGDAWDGWVSGAVSVLQWSPSNHHKPSQIDHKPTTNRPQTHHKPCTSHGRSRAPVAPPPGHPGATNAPPFGRRPPPEGASFVDPGCLGGGATGARLRQWLVNGLWCVCCRFVVGLWLVCGRCVVGLWSV